MLVTLASQIMSNFCPIPTFYAQIPAFYAKLPALYAAIPDFYAISIFLVSTVPVTYLGWSS